MAHVTLRSKAIELRKQGKTYREIRIELNIPKSTLSNWLSDHPLTDSELAILQNSIEKSRYLAIEKIRITKQKKREHRLKNTYELQKNYLLPLNERELYIAGLFLYWGEGQKGNGYIGISNTNPKVIKMSMYWLTKIMKIPKNKIRIKLHLYSDMDLNEEKEYWKKQLKTSDNQFVKPYIKISTRQGLSYKGFGHGTCNLLTSDVLIKEKILTGIEAISDFYCSRI